MRQTHPRGPFKTQSLQYLRERGVPISTVIDVGVHHATPELIEAFPDLHHLLFEPVEEFNEPIGRNYSEIPHTLINAAVSDREGETVLEIHNIFGGDGISHSNIAGGSPSEPNKRSVPVVTIDGHLSRSQAPAPYLLKIDVDGHELAILRGAENTLRETSVVIIEAPKFELSARVAAVESFGFELFDLADITYYDGSFWQCDAILINKTIQRKLFKHIHDGFESDLYKTFG